MLTAMCLGQRGAMTTTQICIFGWAILGMIVVAILLPAGMSGEEKFLIDVALVVIVIWVRSQRNGPG